MVDKIFHSVSIFVFFLFNDRCALQVYNIVQNKTIKFPDFLIIRVWFIIILFVLFKTIIEALFFSEYLPCWLSLSCEYIDFHIFNFEYVLVTVLSLNIWFLPIIILIIWIIIENWQRKSFKIIVLKLFYFLSSSHIISKVLVIVAFFSHIWLWISCKISSLHHITEFIIFDILVFEPFRINIRLNNAYLILIAIYLGSCVMNNFFILK